MTDDDDDDYSYYYMLRNISPLPLLHALNQSIR